MCFVGLMFANATPEHDVLASIQWSETLTTTETFVMVDQGELLQNFAVAVEVGGMIPPCLQYQV